MKGVAAVPIKRRVVDHIVDRLASIGVDHIFGVEGANIEDLYDAAHLRSDVTAVLTKHEFSAATMADGYSRGGAGLGVVAATSGGGALNLVAALGESLTSGGSGAGAGRSNSVLSSEVLRHRRGEPTAAGTLYR